MKDIEPGTHGELRPTSGRPVLRGKMPSEGPPANAKSNDFASLGELEMQVLKLFWRHQPCTERQISDEVQKTRPVARTTVLKTVQRLEAKGFLKRVPGETPIQFRAVLDEKRVLPALIGRFVEQVLGGSPGPLAAYLASSSSEKLSDKDIRALLAIAEKMESDSKEE